MYQNAATDTDLGHYFTELRDKRVLTREEEGSLSKRIQKGDEDARRHLVESNLKLVVKIARGYRTSRVSLAELIQEGNVGLVQAVNKFDYRKNVRFSTYAAPWIKQAINRYINDRCRLISIPHRKEAMLKRIRLARETLQHDLGHDPTQREISTFLGVPEDEIERHLGFEFDVCPIESDDPSKSVMRSWQDTSFTPERELIDKNIREETKRIIMNLMQIEQVVIRHRFALHGAKKMTLRELGEHLGLSAESVRLVEKRAIRKLRVHAEPLHDLLSEN